MESNEYYAQNENEEEVENYNNIKNLLIITLIIIFAYLIEKIFRNSFIKMFYLIIILLIIIAFIILNFSQQNVNKIKDLFFLNFFGISNNKYDEYNKKKLEKVKNIYESGYMNNKINNNNYELNRLNNKQGINNKYDRYNQLKNDDILATKISNINKINTDYFNNNNFSNSNENNNFNRNNNNDYNIDYNNNYINQKIYNNSNYFTNLPDNDSIKENNKLIQNDVNPYKLSLIKNNDMLQSPFNQRTRLPPLSIKSSENFFLLSNKNNINKNIQETSSNKNISNFEYTNPINKIPNISDLPKISNFNYDFSEMKNIPRNKEVSYYKFQYLKSKYENTQALNQNYNELNYDINKIPRELMQISYKNWIIKMKNFISRNLIPNIITKHENNISNLNSILNSLGIEISSTLCNFEDNINLNEFMEKIYFLNSNKINIASNYNDNKLNNILFKNIDKNFHFKKNQNGGDLGINNYSGFPSLINFSNYFNDTKELENKKYNEGKQLNKIFFGDANLIKQLISKVENKINDLSIKKMGNRKITEPVKIKIINEINLNNNPFLINENLQKMDYLFKDINYINNPTLTSLQRLLYERIIINERLYPKELFASKDPSHALLVLEYTIERLKQLQQDFDLYGNGSGGGDFLNENWCSLLPTDSQIISHLIINYIESIYEIYNNKGSKQIFLLSYPNNSNVFTKNEINIQTQTSVFLYQINPPSVEPKFNVVYDGNLIPCPSKDINLFQAFSIYFYLLSIKSPMFVKLLGIHRFINELIK